MDIRRYFTVTGGNKTSKPPPPPPSSSSSASHSSKDKKKKKRNVIQDSDEDTPTKAVPKRQRRIVDSDSDDEIFVLTPSKKDDKKKESSSNSKGKRQQKPESPKQHSTALDFFGTQPVTTTTTPKSKTSTSHKKKDVGNHDSDFAKTLQQLDEQESHPPRDTKGNSKQISSSVKDNEKSKSSESFEKTLKQLDEQKTHKRKEVKQSPKDHTSEEPKPKPNENSPPEKKPSKETTTASKLSSKLEKFRHTKRDLSESSGTTRNEASDVQSKEKKIKLETDEETEKTPRKDKRVTPSKKESAQKDKKAESEEVKSVKEEKSESDAKNSSGKVKKESEVTPMKGVKEETQASETTPQDEKKNTARKAYFKFLHRSGPANPGSKSIPEGKPECLQGLVFVLSGVFDSLDREQATELVKQYGGKVTSSLSRNTSYLVVGVEAGEAKLKKAEQLGTKQIDEDGLLELIATLPGKESKEATTPKQGSGVSKLKKFAAASAKESEPKDALTPPPEGTSSSRSPSGGVKTLKKKVPAKDTEPKDILTPPLEESDSSTPTKATTKTITTTITTPKKTSPPPSSQDSGSPSSSMSSPRTQPISSQQLSARSEDVLMWVDKYKPASTKNIIGQQGGASNVKKLLTWLQNWQNNQLGDKRPPQPSPWAKDDTGGYYKAALLSGPPGVGKTTTAHLVCKEVGYDVLELNASDARSKKTLDQIVSELLSNKSLAGFATGGGRTSTKHALVMDEVDGMSGNEDRGGVQELIGLIKKSKIPIITMCNDRNHPKIRSLANHCFDLRFYKPRVEQIRGPMLSVCYREGIKIKPEALDQIIIGSNQDIRQVLHHLSMWSANDKNLQTENVKREANKAKKDFKKGPWDVCRTVFTESERKDLNIHAKSDLFFHDYSIAPLFVQENYPKVVPHCAKGNKRATLQQVAKTAMSLCDGDLVERLIRSCNAWSLLPAQAMYSSVLPGEYMSGHLAAQIEFPAWFGKNSRRNKLDRLAQELQMHMRLRISGTKRDVGMDYCQILRDSVVMPLVENGAEGVDSAVEAMNSYDLLREDLEALTELSSWPNTKNPFGTVDSKVKAAFTRKFNKDGHLTPFAAPSIKKNKKTKPTDSYGDEEEEEEEENEEEEEDISTSAMIKVKGGGGKGKGTATGGGGGGGGKGKGAGRGRGGGGKRGRGK